MYPMKLRQILRSYFVFTKGERVGVMVLLVLIVLTILANQLIYYFERPTAADQYAFEQAVAKLHVGELASERAPLHLFQFDPNNIDSAGLAHLDLPVALKRNLLRYRAKGGRFRRAQDFRKLYGMNDSIFQLVRPFLIVNPPADENKNDIQEVSRRQYKSQDSLMISKSAYKQKELPVIIELNLASAEELEALKGIGPTLSKRIVKYRDLLGGFAFPEQLSEVYGVSPETVDAILPSVKTDTCYVKKIDLNFMNEKELSAHPYINFKLARKIVDFRSKNGYISNKNQLLSDSIVDKKLFQKLVYYLK